MQVKINDLVHDRIREYYNNAAKSYPSMDVFDCVIRVHMEIDKVGTSLMRTTKTLPKWSEYGYNVCYSQLTKWYFAYRVDGDTIYVEGAEYGGNMSGNAFTATSNRKTDGNYNPNSQFIDDGKHRSRTFIISERQLDVIKNAILKEENEEITYYQFETELQIFLKSLLEHPITCTLGNFWKSRGFSKNKMIEYLLKTGVLEKNEKVNTDNIDGPQLEIFYKVLKNGFDRKKRRMFIKLFEGETKSSTKLIVENMVYDNSNSLLKESRNKSYGGLEWLKNHQVELSEEEKKYFEKHGVLYWDGSGNKLIHKATAKNKEDGEVYFSYTHRAWQCCEVHQKAKAVENAKFIITTS
jgi:hypothetical protein